MAKTVSRTKGISVCCITIIEGPNQCSGIFGVP